MSTSTYQPETTYTANQPYNQNPAYQLHSTILEPAEYDGDDGSLKLTYRPFQLNSMIYGNPALLQELSVFRYGKVTHQTNKYLWKYESRHKAQAILPYLHLGPASIARDGVYIAQNDISMVIAVRSAQSARAHPKLLDPSRFPSCTNLQTATFDVDSPFHVIQGIQPMIKMMTDHLEARTAIRPVSSLENVGGKILVICESGNDRSPVLVAAYLMLLYGIAWHESLNLIHAYRFSVSLSGNMNHMLKTLDGMFRAEADTATVFNSSQDQHQAKEEGGEGRRSSKRTIDDTCDSDETMTDEQEVSVRPGIAPFADAI